MFKRLFSRSRMTRECPVRFYEGPQGLTKGSTHQKLSLVALVVLLLSATTVSDLFGMCFQDSDCGSGKCFVSEPGVSFCHAPLGTGKTVLNCSDFYDIEGGSVCATGLTCLDVDTDVGFQCVATETSFCSKLTGCSVPQSAGRPPLNGSVCNMGHDLADQPLCWTSQGQCLQIAPPSPPVIGDPCVACLAYPVDSGQSYDSCQLSSYLGCSFPNNDYTQIGTCESVSAVSSKLGSKTPIAATPKKLAASKALMAVPKKKLAVSKKLAAAKK